MKRLAVLGMTVLMVLGIVAVTHGVTQVWMTANTTGYTELNEIITTATAQVCEAVTFTPPVGNGGAFSFYKYAAVAPGNPLNPDDNPSAFYEHKTIDASGGTTNFIQCAVAGYDDDAAGYISERITNIDAIHIDKYVTSYAAWHLKEHKVVSGNGETTIHKDVTSWGKASGCHWTNAGAAISFNGETLDFGYPVDFPTYYTDGIGGALRGTLPSFDATCAMCVEHILGGEDAVPSPADVFEFDLYTNETFTFTEDAAINPFWPLMGPDGCDAVPGSPPE